MLTLLACSDYKLELGEDDPDGADEACALVTDTGAVPVDEACVVDPVVGGFSPVVEWRWETNPTYPGYDDIMATPVVGNLTDDNGDGRIDELDVPEIVFASFSGGAYTSAGTLTAISGDGSGQRWSVYDAGGHGIYSSGTPAIGDLEGDGVPEVCTAGTDVAVVCLNADGSFKWAGGSEVYYVGAPALADIEGDGDAEVVFGRTLLDTDGTVRWTGTGGVGRSMSFPIDLDLDGTLEVVTGNTAYNADGSVRWSAHVPDGIAAAGDFDLDGFPEIVNVSGGPTLIDLDGTVLWTTSTPGGGGGPPTVADFDGDGLPEIGVAGAYYYVVFDTDGSVLWQASVQDYSSSVTGSSVFDFEGDGLADVVYADEVTLWVYDGATGAVKFRLDDHASGTLFEYPLIVDVDNDGATEVVVASNDYAFDGWNGITVIGDAYGTWRPSRPIWNQFAYSITNVEDDGGIPRAAEPNWLRFNNFRAGGSLLGLTSELPDLAPSPRETCLVECADGVVEVTVSLENRGTADATAFEAQMVSSAGRVLTAATYTLTSGRRVTLGPRRISAEEWEDAVYVRVDDANAVEECDESNNILDLGPWPCP